MRYLILFAMALLLLSACEKPECEKASDCSDRKCNTVKCGDGKCQYTPEKGCCGNLMCEKDLGESFCNCESDCSKDKCEGMVEVDKNKYGPIKAQYLQRYCEEDKCVVGVPQDKIRQITLLDEKQLRTMKVTSTVTMNKPFNIDTDYLTINLAVRELGADIMPPVRVTGIKVTSGEQLWAIKKTNHTIEKSGEEFIETVPLTYMPQKLEEEKTVSIKIDYEYKQIIDKQNGTRQISDTYENPLSERLFLVNPSGAE
jgi:hypothetical protein